MKEDTVNSNAMYTVDIENLYASRNDMLMSIFQNLFNFKLSPVTKYKSIQIWNYGNSSLE